MRFEIDENLPLEFADLLQQAGHDVATVTGLALKGERDSFLIRQCQQDERILVTLDQGFADIRTYPPQEYSGMIVLCTSRQDKPFLLNIFQRVIALLAQEPLEHRTWLVGEDHIRVRE